MSKPTPGPYTIVKSNQQEFCGGELTGGRDETIAHFFGRSGIGEANARTWVEGREAVATLAKIKDICWNQNEPASRLAEIVALLNPTTGGKAST